MAEGEAPHVHVLRGDSRRGREANPRVTVRVRHADDPLIAAANLTGGALEFPLGDAPKVAGALELLICGALLSVPALVFFCTYGGCGPGWPCHGGRYREGDTRVRLDDLELIPIAETSTR